MLMYHLLFISLFQMWLYIPLVLVLPLPSLLVVQAHPGDPGSPKNYRSESIFNITVKLV